MRRAILIVPLIAAVYGHGKPELPKAEGRALVLRVCTKCHGVETFAGIRMSRDEWKFKVDSMISRGAKANRRDARRIVDYLAKHLGPEDAAGK
jgi:hypothetical protein